MSVVAIVDVTFFLYAWQRYREDNVGECGFKVRGPQRIHRMRNFFDYSVKKSWRHANTDHLIQNECFILRVKGWGGGD